MRYVILIGLITLVLISGCNHSKSDVKCNQMTCENHTLDWHKGYNVGIHDCELMIDSKLNHTELTFKDTNYCKQHRFLDGCKVNKSGE